jgi:hypothetical protein
VERGAEGEGEGRRGGRLGFQPTASLSLPGLPGLSVDSLVGLPFVNPTDLGFRWGRWKTEHVPGPRNQR